MLKRTNIAKATLALTLVAALWVNAPLCAWLQPRAAEAEATVGPEPAAVQDEEAAQEVTADELAGDEALLSSLKSDLTLSTQAKLDALFERYDALGACVCIIENGEIAYVFCYGSVSPDGAAVTENTLFRVGSISKMVAAMGVMRLVEDGATTLDVDLSNLFGFKVRSPQYPQTPVTLRQVMSHTAALRDSGYYTLALRGEARPLTNLFIGDAAQYLFLQNVKPGTQERYSNFGGGLLGSVIEKLSGRTLDDYLSDVLFTPLNITAKYQGALIPSDASVADMYAMPSRRLSAAVRGDTAAYDTADPLTHYTLTAGKLAISAPDLSRLLIALCDGGVYGNTRVLRESSVAAMRTPQNNVGTVACQSDWGLDMNIITDTLVEGRTLYGHGGKANGMLCAAYFDPTDRTGVVMLTNGCDNQKAYNGIGMLSLMTIRLCYTELLESNHTTQDPWLVEP